MAAPTLSNLIAKGCDWLIDACVNRIYGPPIYFQREVPHAATPPAADGAAPVDPGSRRPGSGGIHDLPAETPAELIAEVKAAFDLADRLPGRGHRADNCTFVDEALHQCTNSYGDLCRPGQDCYPSARRESLLSFIDRHPSFEGLAS